VIRRPFIYEIECGHCKAFLQLVRAQEDGRLAGLTPTILCPRCGKLNLTKKANR
jgi:phage FluMu protein Com